VRCLGAPVLMSEHLESSPLVVVQLRHCSPVSVSRGGCSFQFGRASTGRTFIPLAEANVEGAKKLIEFTLIDEGRTLQRDADAVR
jgi:hypothetical protein